MYYQIFKCQFKNSISYILDRHVYDHFWYQFSHFQLQCFLVIVVRLLAKENVHTDTSFLFHFEKKEKNTFS
jgi:hypothetical protein